MLRRLAVFGLGNTSQKSADDKVKWLMERQVIYDHRLKHEVFVVLKTSYSRTSATVRKALLRVVDKGICGPEAKRLRRLTLAYEKFNLLVWLSRSDPSCLLVRKRLNAIQKRHPRFKAREHPEFDSWMSVGWRGEESPVSIDELLSMNVEKKLKWMTTYSSRSGSGPNRSGLLNAISEACSRQFDWALTLAKALQAHKTWDSDIWHYVFRAWGELKDHTQAQSVINFIGNCEQFPGKLSDVAQMIWRLTNAHSREMSAADLDFTELVIIRVATALAHAISKNELESVDEDESDWYSAAINNECGQIIGAMIRIFENRREGDVLMSTPATARAVIKNLTIDASRCGLCAIAACGRYLPFFFYTDPEWAREELIPLMKWSHPQRAIPAWHGYLHNNSVYQRCLGDLLPIYQESYVKLGHELAHVAEQFLDHMALITIHIWQNPLGSQNLPNLIRTIQPKHRALFAQVLGRYIGRMTPDGVQKAWNLWIKSYWKNRLHGDPAVVDDDEAVAMQSWVWVLTPVFEGAVELACQMPASRSERFDLFRHCPENDIESRFPSVFAKLVLHWLSPATRAHWMLARVEELAAKLATTTLETPTYVQICNELARHGSSKAAGLKLLRINGQ